MAEATPTLCRLSRTSSTVCCACSQLTRPTDQLYLGIASIQLGHTAGLVEQDRRTVCYHDRQLETSYIIASFLTVIFHKVV